MPVAILGGSPCSYRLIEEERVFTRGLVSSLGLN